MGWQSEVVLASQVIIFGSGDGLFVYNGSPGPGNPPIFAISTSSQDPYGNSITANSIMDTGLPFLLYAPSPGAGNLILSLATSPGSDIYGNAFNQGLQVGNQAQDTWFGVVADVNENVTYNSNTGLLQALAELWTSDGGLVAPGLLGPALLNAGSPDQQQVALLSSPLLAQGGMGIMLLAESDDASIPAGVALCSVTQSAGGVTFTPAMLVQPNAITEYASTGQTVTVLTGSGNWNAPAGTPATIEVECWGAGGGGGGGTSSSVPGAGGGGGEYAAELALAVTAGNNYAYAAPGGGAGGASGGGTGSTPANTTFAGDSVTVTANSGNAGSASAGGAGGTGSTNTVSNAGGSGGTGSVTGGGGSGSQAYTSGSGNWTCPSGVTSVSVAAIGGGGGGGASFVDSGYGGSGGGGGGSAVSTGHTTVPGNKYAYSVGAGGAGGSASAETNGSAGGNSTMTIGTTVTAHGGGGGNLQGWNTTGAGGAAGTGGKAGGAGGMSENTLGQTNASGGGGGGAAGTTGAGSTGGQGSQNSTGPPGGNGGAGTPAGGKGGAGGDYTGATSGLGGGAPGAGGGGGGTSVDGNGYGGAGHSGEIYISWTANSANGGGGGSSGGTNSAGNSASPGTAPAGATAVTGGGPGGNGGANSAGNSPGSAPGGGGGGGGGNFAGGAGSAGRIRLTYTLTSAPSVSVTRSISAGGYPVVTPSVDSVTYQMTSFTQSSTGTVTLTTGGVNVPGMSFPVKSGVKYKVFGRVGMTSVAAASSSQIGLNLPGSSNQFFSTECFYTNVAIAPACGYTNSSLNAAERAPMNGDNQLWHFTATFTATASGNCTLGANTLAAADTAVVSNAEWTWIPLS